MWLIDIPHEAHFGGLELALSMFVDVLGSSGSAGGRSGSDEIMDGRAADAMRD